MASGNASRNAVNWAGAGMGLPCSVYLRRCWNILVESFSVRDRSESGSAVRGKEALGEGLCGMSSRRFEVEWSLTPALLLVSVVSALGGDTREARGQTPTRHLRLRTGAVVISPESDLLRNPPWTPNPRDRYVLQLDGPMTPSRRAALTGAGAVLGDYLPDDAFVVRLDRGARRKLASLGFIRWLGRLRPEWKIAPALAVAADWAAPPSSQPARVIVSLFPGEDPGRVAADLRACGSVDVSPRQVGGNWFLSGALSLAAVVATVEDPAVQYVEPMPRLSLRNDTNAWTVQSNVVDSTPVWDAGILGQNQIAGLIDTGVDREHCAFRDSAPIGPWHRKFVAVRGDAIPDWHGTHVASTLAGDAGTIGTPEGYDGIAPGGKLSFTDFVLIQADPMTVYARFQDAHLDGARVHSNSWGDDADTQYTLLCRLVDAFAYDYEESLIVFAIANQSTVRTPENAKNVLAVGASADTPWQDYRYSGGAGPTIDGRRKPEVFAPGAGTYSARPDPFDSCQFGQASGTSMACPLVAGAGLLVRQYFVAGYYPSGDPPTGLPFLPSGAMIKAVLINGAVDMTGVPTGQNLYPSDEEGWGRILLDNTLRFPGDVRKLWVHDVRNASGLYTNDAWSSPSITVNGGSVPLRVTLVYTEPPASVLASDPVVNNLDLEVLGPMGGSALLYRGNVFSGGQSVAGGTPDARNNVEQVHLIAPASGQYVVTVRGTAVNVGRQGFAVVVTGDITAEPIPPDCNGNGIPDAQDILNSTSQDCQPDGIPDECESLQDCNSNQIPDVCETLTDCNSDGVADVCQAQLDCNGNATPDVCESLPDCNFNAIPDTCDIATQPATDCQPNGIPDECEVPLATDLYAGPGGAVIPDGNTNGVSRTVFVADHGPVDNVDLELVVTHDWNGDLVVKLSHGSVVAVLVHRPGYPVPNPFYGYGDTGLDVTLDDWTALSIETYTTGGTGAVVGTFRPYPNLLESFKGLDRYGNWTVQVIDVPTDYPGPDGTLVSWRLRISQAVGPPPGCTYPGDCNGDARVTLADYPQFGSCLGGPGVTLAANCECADTDCDLDGDLRDFSWFQKFIALP